MRGNQIYAVSLSICFEKIELHSVVTGGDAGPRKNLIADKQAMEKSHLKLGVVYMHTKRNMQVYESNSYSMHFRKSTKDVTGAINNEK